MSLVKFILSHRWISRSSSHVRAASVASVVIPIVVHVRTLVVLEVVVIAGVMVSLVLPHFVVWWSLIVS